MQNTTYTTQHQSTLSTINKQNTIACRILEFGQNTTMLREIKNQDISSGVNSSVSSGVNNFKKSVDYWKENGDVGVGNQNGEGRQVRKYSYVGKEYLNNLHNSKISLNVSFAPQLPQPQQQQQQSTLLQKISLLQKQKQKLIKRNNEYLHQNEQLTIKITLLKQQHKTQQADQKRKMEQMMEEIGKLKDINKILNGKCRQLIQENQRICCIQQQLEVNLQRQMKMRVSGQHDEQYSIEQQQSKWQNCLKQQQQKYQQLKLTTQSQTIALNTLQSALKIKQQQTQHTLKQKQQQLSKITTQLTAAKAQITRLGNQINIIRIQLEYKNMEYETLSTKLVGKEKQLENVVEENRELLDKNGQVAQLHKTIQQQNSRIAQLTLAVGQKQKQLEQIKTTNKSQYQIMINQLTKAHTKSLQQLNTRIYNNQQQYKQKIAALTNQHIQMKSTLDKNNQKSAEGIQALKQRSNKLVIQKQELKMQIVKLKEINARVNSQYEESQDRYRQAFKQLQQSHMKMRNYQQLVKSLEEQIRQGQLTQRQLAKCKNMADEQLQKIDQNYLQNKRQLEGNIKFLTEELSIWSQKYETLTKQNTSIQSQLLNYKSMYQILTRKHQQAEKNMQHSLISKKSSQKDYKQLVRQLESYKIEMQIMKDQKQKIENSLNQELEKRKEMIESLIREKKMLYAGRALSLAKQE